MSRLCDFPLFSLARNQIIIPLMNALWAFQIMVLLDVVPLLRLKNYFRCLRIEAECLGEWRIKALALQIFVHGEDGKLSMVIDTVHGLTM